jgi:hypothetical protein
MSTSPRKPASTRASSRDCISYFPNDNLAEAIVRAWSDKSYKDDLLTFGEGNAADWSNHTDQQRDSMLIRTSKALEQVGVFLDKAVVLTVEQYESPDFKEKPGELIFVLPRPVGHTPTTLATARVAMAAQCAGI